MSYDVWAEIDSGGPEPVAIEPEGGGNYTSNVSAMWSFCLTAALGEVPAAYAWCGADGALRFLRKLQRLCEQNPKAKLAISS